MLQDYRGDKVSGATSAALTFFEEGLADFNRYWGDPVASADKAIAEAPDFAMAHAMKAHLLLSGMEKDFIPEAATAAHTMRGLKLTDREARHLSAIEAFVRGDFHEASRRLDDLLIEHPRDILALQIGHTLDFYRGDARNLRDRVARARRAWSEDDPGYHALLGMHAFGLEECGDYEKAEACGREAVTREPLDAWAHHAVAHVMEMQGRVGEGIDWLRGGVADWAPNSFFAVHNWWHLALFHLERDEVKTVLDLYDSTIRGSKSGLVIDMVDASAMLWRLDLRGVDVGDRWDELARSWSPRTHDGLYAFSDVHALLALIGAGRTGEAARLVSFMAATAEIPGANGAMMREVGLPLARAFMAFREGRFDETIDITRQVRGIANRFGGSHAQRDLIDLTLIEAAKRGGRTRLLEAFAAERLQHRPDSPLAQRYARFAAAADGTRDRAVA